MHYEDFKGPSRWKINLVPQYFKRSHEFDHERSVERVLVCNALEPVDQASGSEDEPSTKSLMCDATTQCNDPLVEEVRSLKAKLTGEIHHLQTTLQRLDPALLSSSQLFMYTGLNAHKFQCLVSWLTGTSLGRRSRSPDDPATLSFSQNYLWY